VVEENQGELANQGSTRKWSFIKMEVVVAVDNESGANYYLIMLFADYHITASSHTCLCTYFILRFSVTKFYQVLLSITSVLGISGLSRQHYRHNVQRQLLPTSTGALVDR